MGRKGTRLGQNFLQDEAATLRIADALGDVSRRIVVEIGPGHGAITTHLASRATHLHLVEFDPALVRELSFRFRENPRVTVHHTDILKADLGDMRAGENTLDVVGNLPYYITSEILLHLFAAARAGVVRRAVLMTQREVAERVAAQPGHREYGALSALAHLHGDVEDLFTLPPSAFSPPPEVFSTVFRMDFAPRFRALQVPFEGFNRFLRASFAQKRKTLANNLRAAGFSADRLTAAWPAQLAPLVRSEAVSLSTLAELYRALTPSDNTAPEPDAEASGPSEQATLG